MKSIENHNPILTFSYFLAVTLPVMFSMNPVMLMLSLAGALALFFVKNGIKNARSHLLFFALFLVIAFANPLFQHNGVTVLFVLNGNPITWEAIFYGIMAGLMTVSVLYWFRLLSQMMTSDKYLYIFGRFSAKLALLLSMALRYVPLFGKRMKAIRMSQKAIGLYRDGTLIDKIRGEVRIFSIMVTWALENGIHTADSMEARGYGIGKRTSFAIFRFHLSDGILLSMILVLLGMTLAGLATGAVDFVFYPAIIPHEASVFAVVIYTAYGILALLPTILEMEERIKWHFLRSKI